MQIDGTITIGLLIGTSITLLLAVWAGVWALVTLVVKQFSMRMDLKFEALGNEVKARDSRITRLEDDCKRIEREHSNFVLTVTREYITHDQKVALETALIGRMDGLAHQFEKLINVARN